MMNNLEITQSDFLAPLGQETNFLNLEVSEAASLEELNYVWGTQSYWATPLNDSIEAIDWKDDAAGINLEAFEALYLAGERGNNSGKVDLLGADKTNILVEGDNNDSLLYLDNDSSGDAINTTPRSIAFIDPTVADYQSLVGGTQATEVFVLDPSQDGVRQIGSVLAQRQDIAEVHIISHGTMGNLRLGNASLGIDTLDFYRDELQNWADALTNNADILLYGCNVASQPAGQTFVQELSQLTGADIAASEDLTGNATLGGDWELEQTTGEIEASLALENWVIDTYQNVLLQIDFPDFSDTSSLTLNGNAIAEDSRLRITPAEVAQVGSAFFNDAVAIESDTSFQTQFQFQLSEGQGTDGADGFTFMLQDSTAGVNALGRSGGSLGYDDIELGTNPAIFPSLAVEFDTYANGWDINDNHVAVLQDGDVTNNLAVATPTLDLNGGSLLNVWVDYDGVADQLDIYLGEDLAQPDNPLISLNVDLEAVVGSSALVGFSGGTGGLVNAQDILSWEFASSEPEPTVDFSQPTFIINEDGSTATVTVERTDGGTEAFTVDYTTSDGTAVADSDYTATSGTLSFAAGETSQTFVIPILNDSLVEEDETINLTLSNPVGATLGNQNTAILTITDDDTTTVDFNFPDFSDTSSLTLNGDAIAEDSRLRITPAEVAQVGSAFFNDAIAIDSDTSFQTQFQFQVSEGEGTNGADGFTFMLQDSTAGTNALGRSGGSLGYDDIELGTNPAIFPSLAVEFDTYANGWDINNNHVAVLQDGDVTSTLEVATPSFDLNGGGLLTAWLDYDGVSDQLDVYLGDDPLTQPENPLLSVNVDIAAVLGSSAWIGFSGGTGGLVNAQDILSWQFSSAPPTNPGTLALGQTAVTVNEGVDNTASITVTRTGGSDGTVGVDYTTVDNTAVADADYTATSGTLLFAPGETTKTITVPILDDEITEGSEIFNLSLDRAVGGANIGLPRTATITIEDDEIALDGFTLDLPDFSDSSSLTLNGNALAEDNRLRLTPAEAAQVGSAFFNDAIAIDSDTSFQSQFQFQVSQGQGTNGADGFTFMLQDGAGGASALGRGGGSLGYDDIGLGTNPAISPSLAVEFDTYANGWDINNNHVAVLQDGDVTNSLAVATPTFDLNGGSLLNVWLDYDGVADQLDVYLGEDLARPDNPLISVNVDLAAVVGSSAFIGFSGGTGGLVNAQDILSWEFASSSELASPVIDFSQPTFTIDEDGGTATIAVNRSGGTTGAATVNYITSDVTATAGSDYTATSGTLSFAAGEVSQTFTIPIFDDSLVERNETINLILSNPSGADLGTQDTAVLSIIDNDPGNFIQETVVTDLTQPTAFDWSSDERLFIAQKNGVVRLFDDGALLPTPFIDISDQVNNVRDRGLLGLAVHPDFPNTPYIYLSFTYDPPEVFDQTGLAGPDQVGNRVSRLIRVTADASTDFTTALPGSEVVLLGTNSTFANISRPDLDSTGDITIPPSCGPDGTLEDCLPSDSQSHSIGAIHFGTDGSLYVSNGDGTSYGRVDPRTIRVQNLDSLSGKLLRIDPITGEGLSDNPFYDGNPNSNRSKVYSYGLRNPFRFTVNPNTNEPFIGDVGWNTWEEVNTGAGVNFGWPYFEGGDGISLQTGGYADLPEAQAFYASGEPVTPAIYAKSHVDGAIAFAVGDFYTGNTFPDIYNNALFVNDFGTGEINALLFDPEGNVDSVKPFADNLPNLVQISTGLDSNLYFANIATGEIGRFRSV